MAKKKWRLNRILTSQGYYLSLSRSTDTLVLIPPLLLAEPVIGHYKMTKRQKITDAIIYISTGFTVVHGLLSLIQAHNRSLYDILIYHYSDSIPWYVLMFGLPLITGIAFYFWIKDYNITKVVKFLFRTLFFLQLTFSLVVAIKNTSYWGYTFKRPTVFKELSNTANILECSKVTNYDSTGLQPLYIVVDTTGNFEDLYGRIDPYYGNIDRPFMVFQDNSHKNGDFNFSNAYYDQNRSIPIHELLSIDSQIQKTGFVVKGEKNSYFDLLGILDGVITKFQTADNKTYVFAGLNGRQVSNDHYPYYEFLFKEENGKYTMTKKQKYFIDMAGIEGIEYANIAPVFSLILTVIGLVLLTIIVFTNRILKRVNKKKNAL